MSVKSHLFSGILVVEMLGIVSTGYAQPATSPGFYRKNFVQEQPPREETRQGTHLMSAPSPRDLQQTNRVENRGSNPVPDATSAEPSNSRRITPSGVVYVTSIDSEHFSRVCNKVLALQRQGKIRINLILHYGNYENVSEQQKTTLLQHGVQVIELPELPTDIPLSQSPAWVIFSDDAQRSVDSGAPIGYLVQGYFNIEQFFDQYGSFALPAGMSDDQEGQQSAGKLSGF